MTKWLLFHKIITKHWWSQHVIYSIIGRKFLNIIEYFDDLQFVTYLKIIFIYHKNRLPWLISTLVDIVCNNKHKFITNDEDVYGGLDKFTFLHMIKITKLIQITTVKKDVSDKCNHQHNNCKTFTIQSL